jgi:hypothetical protein
MADMGRAIGVRDRRGDVEAAHERPLKQKFLSGDENLSVQRGGMVACHARESGHPDFRSQGWIPAFERVKESIFRWRAVIGRGDG